MTKQLELRRATTALYLVLAILPAVILSILVFEAPRLPLSYVFSATQSRPLALVLSGLAIGALVVAASVPRISSPVMVRWLMLPSVALVALAFAWGILAALLYALGVLMLFALAKKPSGHDP
jgi:hypothetical protein